MIQAFTQSTFDVYISTEDNRIDTSVTENQIRHLFKFINDMDGCIQYAYGATEAIFNRYTKLSFSYSTTPDMYAGETKLLPAGHYKYEVYEVSWIGTPTLTETTAPATETTVLPVSNANGVVQGLATKGILNVTEKVGTEQVQYTQHEEPDGDNYIWYGGGAAPENTFTFSVNTANTSTDSSSSSQYKLPLVDAGAINMKVYWGDGSDDTITSYDQAEVLHTYASPGTYTINIENEVRGWQQYESTTGNKKDHLKMLEISKWNNFTITDDAAFSFSENMTVSATDKPTIETTTLAWCFRDCSSFNTDIDDWDLSAVTSIASMFHNCTLFNQPLNSWNTSNVSSFGSTFQDCPAFNQPLNNWDTSSGVNFSNMFFQATIFNQNIGNWVMGSATNITGMFAVATAFDQDISGWDMRNVTIATNFFNASGLSTTNYDTLLVIWVANTPVASSLTIDFGTSEYTLGGVPEASRTNLIDIHGWTITDGGGI
tara:strand:- start:1167 stop:2624 length:1458 start_codon:yes stop_codon:yes gene_type:complete